MTAAARVLFEFEDTYARAVPALATPWRVRPFPAPRLVIVNAELAGELGVDPAELDAGLLSGAAPDALQPYALAYAGHQFGGYVPRLGDGRALLLGEVLDRAGQRRDVHLKGSGVTPYARGGDGKAPLGPMLREYLMGEAMHALGIPTTRALAVVATGEEVARESYEPGAVLTRIAASHLRVGTFQYAAASGEPGVLRALADYAIARHYPDVAAGDYGELYRRVIAAQASLVARWMLVGFVHGVMNTDNTTISGETIDYGPCAFLDAFSLSAVFSSIDHAARYSYGNQPGIAQWNLARFGETLVPLISDDRDTAIAAATDAVNGFAEQFQRHWSAGLAAKLGLPEPAADLTGELLALLETQSVDWTGFFRALSTAVRAAGSTGTGSGSTGAGSTGADATTGAGSTSVDVGSVRAMFEDSAPFDEWAGRWAAALPADRVATAAAMDRVNPIYIPRNHLVERALTAATADDLAPFERLLDILRRPFDERADDPDAAEYARPAPPDAAPHVTFCGT